MHEGRARTMPMSSVTRRRVVVGIAIVGVALAVLPARPFAQKPPVRIGLATQTEGPALRDGRAYTRAFKTAIAYINERGGILGGRKVEGVIVPQGLTGEAAKAAALRLAQRERVKALIGP